MGREAARAVWLEAMRRPGLLVPRAEPGGFEPADRGRGVNPTRGSAALRYLRWR